MGIICRYKLGILHHGWQASRSLFGYGQASCIHVRAQSCFPNSPWCHSVLHILSFICHIQITHPCPVSKDLSPLLHIHSFLFDIQITILPQFSKIFLPYCTFSASSAISGYPSLSSFQRPFSPSNLVMIQWPPDNGTKSS